MKKLFLFCGLICAAGLGYAADTKISELPAASALAGTEAIPAVQSSATVKTTPSAIATYVESNLTGAEVVGKFSGTCDSTTFLRGDASCAAQSVPAVVTGTHEFSGAITFSAAGNIFTGTVQTSDDLNITGALYRGGAISPSTLSSTQNNFNPTSLGARNTWRLTPASGGTTITGIQAQTNGYVATFFNIGTSDDLIFPNESGSSTSSNQILTPGAATLTIPAGGSVSFRYDGTTSRWRVMAATVVTSISVPLIASAEITNNGSCSVTNGRNVASASNFSTGTCIVTFDTGYFGLDTPNCTATPKFVSASLSDLSIVFISAATATDVTVVTAAPDGSGAVDKDFYVSCSIS